MNTKTVLFFVGEAAEVGEDGTAINLTEMDSGELRDLVVRLEKERAELIEEKKERDEEFGRHRAMFKEMYMLKEGTDSILLNLGNCQNRHFIHRTDAAEERKIEIVNAYLW